MILVLIFLLGWPFEWPAIVLVFLPIFYPVVAAMKIDLVWFGALVAVVLQTAFLSPPVAMSAYYLKQVVKDWSLTTIYGGMFQFMIIQVICIATAGRVPADRDLVPGDACRKPPGRRRFPTTIRRSWTASAQAPTLEEDDAEINASAWRSDGAGCSRRPRRYEYAPFRARAGPPQIARAVSRTFGIPWLAW